MSLVAAIDPQEAMWRLLKRLGIHETCPVADVLAALVPTPYKNMSVPRKLLYELAAKGYAELIASGGKNTGVKITSKGRETLGIGKRVKL